MTPRLSHMLSALDGHPLVFTERELLKIMEPRVAEVKAAAAEEKLALVLEALELSPQADLQKQYALKGICAVLLRGGLAMHSLDAVKMVELMAFRRTIFPHKAVLAAIAGVPVTPALREALLNVKAHIDEWIGGPAMRDLHERIDQMLTAHGSSSAAGDHKELEPKGHWSGIVFAEVRESGKQFEWHALFRHAQSLTQSSASKKWLKEALDLSARIGHDDFLAASGRWLALGPTPGATGVQTPEADGDYQKGLVWALGALGDPSIAPAIADFAFACFRKISMIGAVSHKVGNACVNALAVMPGLDAVSQISRLAARVKYDVARRLIEKALVEAAERNGVAREDLEAMSVPSFGLDGSGVREETAADGAVARLSIENGTADLTWSKDGKSLKKTGDAELAAELKKTVKELDGILSAQRVRIERQLLSEYTYRFDRWKAWYLENPVAGYFARRLIWEVGERTAIPVEGGKLVDWAGNTVVPASDDTPVRLWHPIRAGADVQTILSWRCWLEDHGVRQPFKQAHREVYVLTDAERLAATHSNRFAGHILRQHAFAALCRERGWHFRLMGPWDSHNTPTLELPQYGLMAELAVDFPLHEDEVSGHQVYLTIRTGQVRFLRAGGSRAELPQKLDTIPAVVFSEVMRDCDLFAGVTSIAADPAWGRDHSGEPPHIEYWKDTAFGELSTAAENRKSILEGLLPKLGVLREGCRIDGRYLHVRGNLHEYRIHLGSGNVLMEPGSRYLCIVQGAGDSAASLRLPFEGDRVLSLILSKAMLLLSDDRIKDETIRRQL